MKCWSCERETDARPFCPSCGKLAERAPGATHFDVFGLQPAHELDLPALERQYRELSLRLHPDRYAQAAPRERRLSLEHATALNEAYKTLKDPERRAFYLLKLHGVDLDREEGGTQPGMPLEHLEEVMALREALAEAMASRDLARVEAMRVDVSDRRGRALAEGVQALRELAQRPEAKEALTKASHALARVRYFTRFLDQVDTFEEEGLSP